MTSGVHNLCPSVSYFNFRCLVASDLKEALVSTFTETDLACCFVFFFLLSFVAICNGEDVLRGIGCQEKSKRTKTCSSSIYFG